MSLTTFHPFPRLPFEIRQMIWKLATRPSGFGIHDFFFHRRRQVENANGTTLVTLPHKSEVEWVATIPGLNDNNVNQSFCMWDAGMWTACREAREVVKTCYQMSAWNDKRAELLQIYKLFQADIVQATTVNFAEKFNHSPLTIRAPPLQASGGNEEWSLVILPYADAFRLDVDNLRSLVTASWNELNWSKMLDDIGCFLLPGPFFRYAHSRYFVFEYDPSWIRNLPPSNYLQLLNELSPRGLAAALIKQREYREDDDIMLEGYQDKWVINLIDRSGWYCTNKEKIKGCLGIDLPPGIYHYGNEEFAIVRGNDYFLDHIRSIGGRDYRKSAVYYIAKLIRTYSNTPYCICDYVQILVPRRHLMAT